LLYFARKKGRCLSNITGGGGKTARFIPMNAKDAALKITKKGKKFSSSTKKGREMVF